MKKETSLSNTDSAVLNRTSESFDNDVYALVAATAQLQEVALTKSEYKIVPSLFWDLEKGEASLNSKYHGEAMGSHFDSESGVIAGGYKWMAEIKTGRKLALALRADYMLVYSGLEAQPEEYVQLYFRKLARFTTYPYFRALFATNTSLSNIPLPPLPTLIDRVD